MQNKDYPRLRNCPFCNGQAVMWRFGWHHVVIECVNYNVDTHRVYMQGEDEEEVVSAWNRRYECHETRGSD